MADAVFEVQGVPVLVNLIDGADPKSLPDALDQLKNKLGRGRRRARYSTSG